MLWWIAVVNDVQPLGSLVRFHVFQSLLWWIAVVNAAMEGGGSEQIVFQSLLWWIAVVNWGAVAANWGSAMFQSLLWWIAVVNEKLWSSTGRPFSGFNPCCGGLQSSTPDHIRPYGTAQEFQSLLWWIAVVNDLRAVRQPDCGARFQSLLWWIAVVNELDPGDDGADAPVSILVVVDCSRQHGRLGPDVRVL